MSGHGPGRLLLDALEEGMNREERRVWRSFEMIAPDAPIWCQIAGCAPHMIGKKEAVVFVEAENLDTTRQPYLLARCDLHGALVRWMVEGNKIAPPEGDEEAGA